MDGRFRSEIRWFVVMGALDRMPLAMLGKANAKKRGPTIAAGPRVTDVCFEN
jgi:hypothetical protein